MPSEKVMARGTEVVDLLVLDPQAWSSPARRLLSSELRAWTPGHARVATLAARLLSIERTAYRRKAAPLVALLAARRTRRDGGT